MSYGSDSGMFDRMSGKTLAILFGLAFFGAFMLIQMVQGFPLASLFVKETVQEETIIKLKQDSVCSIELSDQQPRDMKDCPYSIGDHVLVTYNKNNFQIVKHQLLVAAGAGGVNGVNDTAR